MSDGAEVTGDHNHHFNHLELNDGSGRRDALFFI